MGIGSMLKRWAEPELRRTQRLLHQANEQLDRALTENAQLKQEKRKLHEEHLELRGQYTELNRAFEKLGKEVSDLRAELKAEKERSDERFQQLMIAKAKQGDL